MKEGWTYKKLGEVCKVLNGLWIGKKEPLVKIAVIRNTNFSKDCKLKLDDVAYIDVEEKQFKARKLQVGDIIIEKSGGSDKQPVGRPVLFNIPDGDYSFSNFTATLRLTDKSIIPQFLHQCLYGYYRNKETTKMQSKTTGLHNLDMKAYLRLPIPYISISEQERIVSELDLLSSIIEKKKAQLKEYDQLAQSIFYDMFGDPVTNEKGWEVKKLGEGFSYIKNGANIKQTKGASGIPITRIETLAGGVFNRDRLGYADIFSTEKYSQYVMEDMDILMSHINSKAYIGRSVLYRKEGGETIIHGMNLLRLKVIKSMLSSIYIVHFFMSDYFKDRVTRIRKDAVNQSSMAISDLIKIPILIPPLSLQQQFAEKIEAIERQKEMIKQSIAETETLFNSRMDFYFN